jgi:hypothetical protein
MEFLKCSQCKHYKKRKFTLAYLLDGFVDKCFHYMNTGKWVDDYECEFKLKKCTPEKK